MSGEMRVFVVELVTRWGRLVSIHEDRQEAERRAQEALQKHDGDVYWWEM